MYLAITRIEHVRNTYCNALYRTNGGRWKEFVVSARLGSRDDASRYALDIFWTLTGQRGQLHYVRNKQGTRTGDCLVTISCDCVNGYIYFLLIVYVV